MFKIIGSPRSHKKKGTSATKIMEEKIILFHSIIILTYVKIKKLKKKNCRSSYFVQVTGTILNFQHLRDKQREISLGIIRKD